MQSGLVDSPILKNSFGYIALEVIKARLVKNTDVSGNMDLYAVVTCDD